MERVTLHTIIDQDRLAKAVQALEEARGRGLTSAEYRDPNENNNHHGKASGAFSILHKNGSIARLADKRGGYKIYVAPQYVFNRQTEPQGRSHLPVTVTYDGPAKMLYPGDQVTGLRA